MFLTLPKKEACFLLFYVLSIYGKSSFILRKNLFLFLTHSHKHTHTHARTHTHIHTHIHSRTLGSIATYSVKMIEYKNVSTRFSLTKVDSCAGALPLPPLLLLPLFLVEEDAPPACLSSSGSIYERK